MKTIKVLTAALLIISLTACGTLSKSVTKEQSATTLKKEAKETTVTTTEEVIDTAVTIAERTITMDAALQPIIDGDTAFIETDEGSIAVVIDKAANRLKATAKFYEKQVPIQMARKTVQETTTQSNSIETASQQSSDKQVKRVTFSWWWLIWIIIAAVVLYYLIKWGRLLYQVTQFKL
jgi:predicted trehalose synthase